MSEAVVIRFRLTVCFQVDVIKKAYQQDSECEDVDVEVSSREVGHNIYILAQQVTNAAF